MSSLTMVRAIARSGEIAQSPVFCTSTFALARRLQSSSSRSALNQFGGPRGGGSGFGSGWCYEPNPRRFTPAGSARSLPANTIINFVPQQEAWVVERFGKFLSVLQPGLQILIPVIDRIKYVQSLKENAIEIPSQSAITSDNVSLDINGVLYIRVVDPFKASYGVEDAETAIKQLAMTTMRSEIGQLTLDSVLKERQSLNNNISTVINQAAEAWGVQCLRYEIKDVHPPENVVSAMHQQVSADRQKRAEILESEGKRQSAINIAEGQRQSVILASEAAKAEKINEATGDAEAILLRAKATATGLQKISTVLADQTGPSAAAYSVAEKYVEAFSKLAKESNTLIIPAQTNDPSGMIAQAISLYKGISAAPFSAGSSSEPSGLSSGEAVGKPAASATSSKGSKA